MIAFRIRVIDIYCVERKNELMEMHRMEYIIPYWIGAKSMEYFTFSCHTNAFCSIFDFYSHRVEIERHLYIVLNEVRTPHCGVRECICIMHLNYARSKMLSNCFPATFWCVNMLIQNESTNGFWLVVEWYFHWRWLCKLTLDIYTHIWECQGFQKEHRSIFNPLNTWMH